jgi:predicted phage terminase large subunit-like protein
MGIVRALQGQRVWWVAPTWAQSSIAWRLAYPLAAQIPGTEIRLGIRSILFPGGGEFWFKSSDQADNLRGEGIDFLVLDEADFQPGDVWESVLRPALADRKGGALFVSTPNLEGGWFHELYKLAERGEAGWKSWSFPSETNPFVDPKEIASARAQLPDIVARREFGAEFVSAGGARIHRAWLRTMAAPDDLSITIGVDLAISEKTSADYTAAVVLGKAQSGAIWVLDAQRVRAPFHQVLEFVKQMAATWKPRLIAIEQVQYQAAVIQELLRTTTLPVVGTRPDRDKVTRFQPLEARYEQGLVRHVPGLNPEFERELLSFPVGTHDDFCDGMSTAFSSAADNYFAEQFMAAMDSIQ